MDPGWIALVISALTGSVQLHTWYSKRQRVDVNLRLVSTATPGDPKNIVSTVVTVSASGQPCGIERVDLPWLGPGDLPKGGAMIWREPMATFTGDPTTIDLSGHLSDPLGVRCSLAAEESRAWQFRTRPIIPGRVLRADVHLVGRKVVRSNVVTLPSADLAEYWQHVARD